MEHITARDMQILELMRSGMGSAEIAESLGLEPGPLSKYIQRAYRILGVENRREFVALLKAGRSL